MTVIKFPGDEAWTRGLHKADNGSLRHKSTGNCFLLLENMELRDCFRFNEFSKEIEIAGPVPWTNKVGRAVRESDLVEILRWFEGVGQFGINPQMCMGVLQAVAEQNSYHPLQSWLTGLKWDGTPRIDKWLSYYLGCEPTPYTQAIGAKFLIGCVARASHPGCKFDNMLILEGPQGILKSSCLEELFTRQYFTDEISDFGSKDAAMQLQGVWCVEVAELSSFTRSAAERIKEFVSRRVDRIRPPYGRLLVNWPRTAVLVGTTNASAGYFQDHTGNRRFWPVVCVNIDLDALKKDREQLWAEAVARYLTDAKWWLEGGEISLAGEEQDKRYDEDAWHGLIAEYVSERGSVTTHEILTLCLSVPIPQVNSSMKNRVARTLTSIGWVPSVGKGVDRKSFRAWKPKTEVKNESVDLPF
jgi:predicted P-loop ATPase